ncbi:MAG: putative ATP-dependent ligase [Methanobacteriaceae archaeon]|nr:putative ATP-dependent ligase [Methanobacteriaceae archaeon]
MDWRRNNSLKNFFFTCEKCDFKGRLYAENFLEKKMAKALGISHERLERAIRRRGVKFYNSIKPALLFKKDLMHIESGTVVYITDDKLEIIRGFPKIRRTLILSPTIEKHFKDKVAVEEKMNGYNVRIASVDSKIVALTRGGYLCPFTTQKVQEFMDLDKFFKDNPDLVICGEMLGTANPYVSHYYPEIGELGFRIFDVREKTTNRPLPIKEKRELLKDYNLPMVRLLGTFPVEKAAEKIKEIVKKLGEEGREGVVIKDPEMELPPIKYTASQAHANEIKYAFNYPFDFGRAFFFSRVVREGFQAYEMKESEEELRERAHRLGEAIIYPMVKTIKEIAEGGIAHEDTTISVSNRKEAMEFIKHLHALGVSATIIEYRDGKAVIRRFHQATTDRTKNFLEGGLY